MLRSFGSVATIFLLGVSCSTLVALTLHSTDDGRVAGPAGSRPISMEQSSSGMSQAKQLPFDFLETTNDLEDADIAELNLRCALGLPGAEKLDIEATLAELDRWADHVHAETQRHLYQFRAAPEEYENSEAYFRALMMIVALQGDLGVHYNLDRVASRISRTVRTCSSTVWLGATTAARAHRCRRCMSPSGGGLGIRCILP